VPPEPTHLAAKYSCGSISQECWLPYKDKNDPRYLEYKKKRVDSVTKWRQETKRKFITALGGQCRNCGYDRCQSALELHHLDPSQKEFSFGQVAANPRSLRGLIDEAKKCVLLCANCHREVHAGLIGRVFDLIFDALVFEKPKKEPKPRVDRRLIKLTNDEVRNILLDLFGGNKSAMGRAYGVSEAAIRKRLKE
jgi:5-methylcytosine-specific restriction endonuclease McrA